MNGEGAERERRFFAARVSLLFAAICMPVGTRYLTHAAALHQELRAAESAR